MNALRCRHVACTVALVWSATAHPVARAQSAPSPDDVVTMEKFAVETFRRDYIGPASGTGLGLEVDLSRTPLTVFSVPMDILTDQQVNNVEDALRNVAAVSKFKQGNGGEEKFSLRGFDVSANLYKDGARINNAFNATNIATTETANIERYEVLKGPAAILYGQGEPGGVINYVTKKPRFDRPLHSFEAIVGTDDYYRFEVDSTAALDSHWAYRSVLSHEDSGSARDFSGRERTLLAPSLSLRTKATLVTLQYEYIRDRYTQDRGQVLDGDNTNGFVYSARLNGEQFFGIPGWNDRTRSEYHRAAVIAEHEVNPDSKLRVVASSTRVDKDLFDSSPRNGADGRVVAANGEVQIRPTLQGGDGESDSVAVQHTLRWASGELAGVDVEHQFMAQGDFERIFNEGTSASAGSNVVYNVANRRYTFPPGGIVLGTVSPLTTRVHQWGFVLQDLVSVGENLNVLVGARYTLHENRAARVDTDEVTPRLGAIYRLTKDLSVYGSWAQGFVPTTATGFNPASGNGIGGPVLSPESTEQFEAGLRWSPLDEAVIVNAALFDLRKGDVVATDPASGTLPAAQQWSANLGDTQTLGFELQVVGRVTRALRLIAGYAYLDNEIQAIDLASRTRPGARLPGIPLHSGNAWAVYEVQSGAARGLGLGAGVFAQSDTFASTENRAVYGAWTQIDAVLYYKRDRWKVQVNAKNLTDRDYTLAQALTTTDSFAAIRVGTSTPFSLTGSFAYEF